MHRVSFTFEGETWYVKSFENDRVTGKTTNVDDAARLTLDDAHAAQERLKNMVANVTIENFLSENIYSSTNN